jgi:CRP/FNR family transcriptional regulator, cyclic AMP receptor protein
MAGSRDWVSGSLFAYLPVQEQEYLLGLGTRRTFRENEVLLRHGDPSDHVLLLVAGWVRVSQASRDDQEMLLALRGPGDVLGDLAALFGWTRSATIRTLDRVEVVQLTSGQFVQSLHSVPEIAIAMVKQMGTRLREAESVRMEVATLDVSHRVTAYLVWLLEQHGRPNGDGYVIDMPLSQQDIANRVGASLRAVARSLAVLRDRQIVRTSRRQFVIVRPDVLRSFRLSTPNDPSMPNDTEGP